MPRIVPFGGRPSTDEAKQLNRRHKGTVFPNNPYQTSVMDSSASNVQASPSSQILKNLSPSLSYLSFNGLPSSYSHNRRPPDLAASSKAYLPASMNPGPIPAHVSESYVRTISGFEHRGWSIRRDNSRDDSSDIHLSHSQSHTTVQSGRSTVGSTSRDSARAGSNLSHTRHFSGIPGASYKLSSIAASSSDAGTAGYSSFLWGRSQRSSHTSLRSQPNPTMRSGNLIPSLDRAHVPVPAHSTIATETATHARRGTKKNTVSDLRPQHPEDEGHNWDLENNVDEVESHRQQRGLPARHEVPLRKGRITIASVAALHGPKAGLSPIPASLLADSPRDDVISLASRSSDTADDRLTGRLSHATAKSTDDHATATPRPPKASSNIERMIVDASRRQYEYLQALHLRELALHDTVLYQQGVLMPNNGCEQVFMPKPHLSPRRSRSRPRSRGKLTRCLDPDEEYVIPHKARSTATNRQHMFFERNRRPSEVLPRDGDHGSVQRPIQRDSWHCLEDQPAFPHDSGLASLNGRRRSASQPNLRHSNSPGRRGDGSEVLADVVPRTAPLEGKQESLCSDSPDLDDIIRQGEELKEERARWRGQFLASIEGRSARRRVSEYSTTDPRSQGILKSSSQPRRQRSLSCFAWPLSCSNNDPFEGGSGARVLQHQNAKVPKHRDARLAAYQQRQPCKSLPTASQLHRTASAKGEKFDAKSSLGPCRGSPSVWKKANVSRRGNAAAQGRMRAIESEESATSAPFDDDVSAKTGETSPTKRMSGFVWQNRGARQKTTSEELVVISRIAQEVQQSRLRGSTTLVTCTSKGASSRLCSSPPPPQSPPPMEPLPALPSQIPASSSNLRQAASSQNDAPAFLVPAMYSQDGDISTTSVSSFGDHFARVVTSWPFPPRRKPVPLLFGEQPNSECAGDNNISEQLTEILGPSPFDDVIVVDDSQSIQSSRSRYSSVLDIPRFGIVDHTDAITLEPPEGAARPLKSDVSTQVSRTMKSESTSHDTRWKCVHSSAAPAMIPDAQPSDIAPLAARVSVSNFSVESLSLWVEPPPSVEFTPNQATGLRKVWNADLDGDDINLRNLFFQRMRDAEFLNASQWPHRGAQ